MPCPSHLTHDPYCWPCNEASRQESARAVAAMNAPPNPDTLATGPTRPGYQHSPATYVEGREAPRQVAPEAFRRIAGRLPDGTAVQVTDDGYRIGVNGDVLAEYKHSDVPNAQAVISAMLDGLAAQMRVKHGPDPFVASYGYPDDAAVERCARAAYEARYADSLHLRRAWDGIDEPTREAWRGIARAVLAAARGGR